MNGFAIRLSRYKTLLRTFLMPLVYFLCFTMWPFLEKVFLWRGIIQHQLCLYVPILSKIIIFDCVDNFDQMAEFDNHDYIRRDRS